MGYIPHSEQDRKQMLEAVGINSGDPEELFGCIPPELRASSFGLEPGMSEFEVDRYLRSLAAKNAANTTASDHSAETYGGPFRVLRELRRSF